MMGSATIPSRDYTAGEDVIDLPQAPDRKFYAYRIAFTREAWPAGIDFMLPDGNIARNTVINVEFERSIDGRATWLPAGGARLLGGKLLNEDGSEKLEAYVQFAAEIPQTRALKEQTADLRVRVQRLVPVKTAVTVTVLEP